MYRAYTTLTVKGFDKADRTFEGIASTPTPDRVGDILEPTGAEFALPLPLLWQHDPHQPIGHVIAAKVTAAGIWVRAQLARVDEPGPLKTRLDDAAQHIEAGLVRGLSVGIKPKDARPIPGTMGLRILKWIWAELSAVTIPQNIEATIHTIKSLAMVPPGPTGPGLFPGVIRPPMGSLMTISEQITQFENTRAATVARINAIMATAQTEDRTLNETEIREYDDHSLKVANVDAHLVRLHAQEKLNAAAAVPVPVVTTTKDGSDIRGGVPVVTVKANVPKGTAFIRYCQALAVCRGGRADAVEYAKRWDDTTPEVGLMLKAAVAAGTTTDATWAGPLAQLQNVTSEFLEYLRPATLLGKIPRLHRVPFNVSIPIQTGGGTYQWVGQGAPKPVGKLAFATVTLGITKCAGIIVITEELAKTSTPSAEETIRNDMVKGIAQFLDIQFTDPANAPVANVSPGSITNGVTPITTTGTTPANARTDLTALINAMTAAGIDAAGAVLLLSQSNATALGYALNPLGQSLFPNLTVTGGTAMGLTAITSQVVGNNVILLQPDEILYADDGGVTIDVSREASVQMDSAPDNPALATTVLTSLWQNNMVGLRADRYVTWKRARTGAVQYTVATYAG